MGPLLYPVGPMTIMPTTRAQFTVTRMWQYEGCEGGIEDSLILVGGQQIGGAYYCANGLWASYGPCGYASGHRTREAAEQVQVREYATNPDLYDRINADVRAGEEAELARQRAGQRHRGDQLRRPGDDEPGQTVWTLPIYHVLHAPMEEVNAVCEWFAANGINGVLTDHEVRVEQRASRRAIVYQTCTAAASWVMALGDRGGCPRNLTTETRVVTLATEPPVIAAPARPDLHGLFEQHWPARFPLVDFGVSVACGHCTREAGATVPAGMVLWPCSTVRDGIRLGRIPAGPER